MLFSEPQVGIEPTTYSLRENRSATELLRLCVEPCAGFEPACACASWLQVKRSRPLSQHGIGWSGRIRTYESRMAADLQSAVVDRCTTLQFFLVLWRRVELNYWPPNFQFGTLPLSYFSIFFCCLTRTRTSTTMVQNHLHYHYAIRQLLRRVTDSNRMRFHAHFV